MCAITRVKGKGDFLSFSFILTLKFSAFSRCPTLYREIAGFFNLYNKLWDMKAQDDDQVWK